MTKYTCNGPRVYHGKEYLGHKGCGQDLTSMIAVIPADGKNHVVTCPKCQTEASIMKTPPNAEPDPMTISDKAIEKLIL